MQNEIIKILIVDDEKSILHTLSKAVEIKFPEVSVFTAENGREAWGLINEHHPAIIVSDISMPEMNGLELCRQVRNTPELNDTYFIVLTAVTDVEQRNKLLNEGADDYISKPVVFDSFLARIRSSLRIVTLQNKMKKEKQLLQQMTVELQKDIKDMTMLALKFMETRIPSLYVMLRKVSDASVWIAKNFDSFSDEELRHIEIAAYLSQAGRIYLPDSLLLTPIFINGLPSDPMMNQVPLSGRNIVMSVKRFEHIGDIIYHIYENIDGSGIPDKLQSWQIPMPSRIIRVALDFFEAISINKISALGSIDMLKRDINRLYDGRAVVLMEHYAKDFIKEAQLENEMPLNLSNLKPDMELTRDIVTNNGLKLMSSGAKLNIRIISQLISHNSRDPILGNVYVKK